MISWTYLIQCLPLHALTDTLHWGKLESHAIVKIRWYSAASNAEEWPSIPSPSNWTKSEDIWKKFRGLRNLLRTKIKQAKRTFYQKALSSKKPKELWQTKILLLILALSLLLLILTSWTSTLLTPRKGYWEPIHPHQNVWKTTSPLRCVSGDCSKHAFYHLK